MELDFIIQFFSECKKFCIKTEKIAGRTNTRGDENCIVQGLVQDFLTEILQRVPLWTAVSLCNRSESNIQRTERQRSLFCALCIWECILFSKDKIFHTFASYAFNHDVNQSFLKKGSIQFYVILFQPSLWHCDCFDPCI